MYHQTITVYVPTVPGEQYMIVVSPENLIRYYDTQASVWRYIEHFTVNAQHRTFTLRVVQES